MTDRETIQSLANIAFPTEPNAAERIIAIMCLPDPVELRADFWNRIKGTKQ